MSRNNEIVNENSDSFFNDNKIDDKTFQIWKSELQKELPSFWESFIKN